MEQQHQHAVNAQHANRHGHGKVGKQRFHFLSVSQFSDLHGSRQVFEARQRTGLGVDFAQLAATELHVKGHVAAAV